MQCSIHVRSENLSATSAVKPLKAQMITMCKGKPANCITGLISYVGLFVLCRIAGTFSTFWSSCSHGCNMSRSEPTSPNSADAEQPYLKQEFSAEHRELKRILVPNRIILTLHTKTNSRQFMSYISTTIRSRVSPHRLPMSSQMSTTASNP